MIYLFLFTYLCSIISPYTIALTNATSNDDSISSNDWYCPTNYGGPCTPDRPYTVTQDESVTGSWLKNEPFACTVIKNSNGPEQWSAQFADGEKRVVHVRVLSKNTDNGFSGTTVSVSGIQCGEAAPYDSELEGTWQTFDCPMDTKVSQVQLDRDAGWLAFCGIEVVAAEEDAAVSFQPELFLIVASLLIFFN